MGSGMCVGTATPHRPASDLGPSWFPPPSALLGASFVVVSAFWPIQVLRGVLFLLTLPCSCRVHKHGRRSLFSRLVLTRESPAGFLAACGCSETACFSVENAVSRKGPRPQGSEWMAALLHPPELVHNVCQLSCKQGHCGKRR